MKILLVIPRGKNLFGDDPQKDSTASHPHVGIAYLAAFLKKNEQDISIFDEAVEGSGDGIIENFIKIPAYL